MIKLPDRLFYNFRASNFVNFPIFSSIQFFDRLILRLSNHQLFDHGMDKLHLNHNHCGPKIVTKSVWLPCLIQHTHFVVSGTEFYSIVVFAMLSINFPTLTKYENGTGKVEPNVLFCLPAWLPAWLLQKQNCLKMKLNNGDVPKFIFLGLAGSLVGTSADLGCFLGIQ